MPELNPTNSPVCPLEYRYGRKEMKAIFTEENKLQKFLDVEAALAEAQADLGIIPKDDAWKISTNANLSAVSTEEVRAIENEIRHDVMAVVKALSNKCGKSGKFVHLGATSNDIIDTATALQIKEAVDFIMQDLEALSKSLLKLAEEHKNTIMVGRTHGQFAVPTTFGLKMAVYASEVQRHIARLDESKERILVGKMTGAVGTGAALGEKALLIQESVMEKLGLKAEEASLQIVGRDRYIEFISILASIATSLEKFATEVRNLQRSEIGEVSEAFDKKKQVGSSTMPHKKNPIVSENICGLARIARSFLLPAFENNVLWHERDLANSSGERFILPHTCVLVDDILVKMTGVFDNLVVNPDAMKRTLESAKGFIMAESMMMALTKKGVGRQEAHEILRNCAIKATEQQTTFKEALVENDTVKKNLSNEELEGALNPENYTGKAVEIVENLLRKYGE